MQNLGWIWEEAMSITEDDPIKEFGNMVRAARKRHGWGARQLVVEMEAAGLGKKVATSAVSGWENGIQFPRDRTLRVLADVLEIPFTDLERACRDGAIAKGHMWVRGRPTLSPATLVCAEDVEFVLNTVKAVGSLELRTVTDLLAALLNKKKNA